MTRLLIRFPSFLSVFSSSSPLTLASTGDLVKSSMPTHVSQHLLIGSTSQAIEFWPGPSDLRAWDWDQYVKYVTTSLDSFGPSLSQLALQVYPPPVVAASVASSSTEFPAAASSSSTASPAVLVTATSLTTSPESTSVSTTAAASGSPAAAALLSSPSTPSHASSLHSMNSSNEGPASASGQAAGNKGSDVKSMNESAAGEVVLREVTGSPTRQEAAHEKEPLSQVHLITSQSMKTLAPTPAALASKSGSSRIKEDGPGATGDPAMRFNGMESSVTSDGLNGTTTPESPSKTSSGNESDANLSQRVRRSIAFSVNAITDSESVNPSPSAADGDEEPEQLSPELMYATMVSDVRQTCPVSQLTSLIKNSTTTAAVHRYVITGSPSTSVSGCARVTL